MTICFINWKTTGVWGLVLQGIYSFDVKCFYDIISLRLNSAGKKNHTTVLTSQNQEDSFISCQLF